MMARHVVWTHSAGLYHDIGITSTNAGWLPLLAARQIIKMRNTSNQQATSFILEKIVDLLNSETTLRQRHGKSNNLRPLIKELILSPEDENSSDKICMRLSAQEGGTGRSEEVLLALEFQPKKHPPWTHKIGLSGLIWHAGNCHYVMVKFHIVTPP